MARIVRQHRRPPYLLIIMTFLFMVATTIAVKERAAREEIAKNTADVGKLTRALASEQELRTPKLTSMIDRYEDPPPGEFRKTVVGQFDEKVDDLAAVILTRGASPEQAVTAARKATYSDDDQQRGLVAEVERLRAELAHLVGPKGRHESGVVKEMKDRILNLYKQIEAKDAQLQLLDDKFRSQIAALERILIQRDKDIQVEHAGHLRLQKEAADIASRRVEQLNAEIHSGQVELEARNKEIMLRDAVILKHERWVAYLDGVIEALKVDRIEKGKLARKIIPDGAVMSDPDRDGYCYIDIGAAAGVKHGWTFAVYEAARASTEAKRKGALVVTRVMPNISECRIVGDAKKDVFTVVKGDLISNVAFDRRYPQKFVVAGWFDLHGSKRPSDAGREAVKKIVRSHRGTVVDAVTVDVDYVILGVEPPRPAADNPDDPPQVRFARKEASKLADAYQAIKKRAIELKIPIMNTHRFVRDMGYNNEKRLVYTD